MKFYTKEHKVRPITSHQVRYSRVGSNQRTQYADLPPCLAFRPEEAAGLVLVAEGVKPAAAFGVYKSDLDSVIDFANRHGLYYSYSESADNAVFFEVSSDPNIIEQLRVAHESGEGDFGTFYGYPSCCQADWWARNNESNLDLEQAARLEHNRALDEYFTTHDKLPDE